MKKRALNIILVIVMLIATLFILTGCGSNKLKSNKDVEEMLEKNYPDESFEIISKEEKELEAHDSSGSVSKGKGYSYNVKSKDTNIEFTVQDTYGYISGGWAKYDIADDYREQATLKYINDYGDERLHFVDDYDIDINVKLSDFTSTEEIANLLYNFKTYLFDKKPFKNSSYYSIYYKVYNNENEVLGTTIPLYKINSTSDIYDYLK